MQRLRASWTRWRQSRRTRRQERQQKRARKVLHPLLLEALTPVALAMQRLEDRQTETRALVEQLALRPTQEQETQELLLEILNSLQPPPELEIARALGLPRPPS